ncbi:hypothetical protein C8R47DRAFT_1083837 [Mycena vitilis]|nr:hypothetical protein C8R47DRAFT_1083837 [Mycena vitilis]
MNSDPEAELAALLAMFGDVAQTAVAASQQCLALQAKLPAVVKAVVEARVAALVLSQAPMIPFWYEDAASTPDELDAAHPAGSADHLAYHVVTIGQEPGLYTNIDDSDHDVPNSQRCEIRGRVAALAHYRVEYNNNRVHKMVRQTWP